MATVVGCVTVIGLMDGVGVMIFVDGAEMTRPATCVVVSVAGSVEVCTGAVACVDVVGVTGSVNAIGFWSGVGTT
jgi:hypothetical protein